MMSPDGKRAYVAGTGGMSVIDTHARKVVASIPEFTGEFLINADGTKAVMFDLYSQPYAGRSA